MNFEENEKQRKMYNKKILKTTFRSEMRNKKFSMIDLLLDVMIFFGATVLAETVNGFAHADFKEREMRPAGRQIPI